MSELFYPNEPSAREIAVSTLARSNARRVIPKDILPLVEELLVDAAHDAIEFGEAIAALPESSPSGLEHYWKGYTDAIEDIGGGSPWQ